MKNNTVIRINNFIMILWIFLFIIILIFLYYDLLFNNQLLHVVEIPIEVVKPNKCIFGLFTEVFKVNNSSYVYYPSHFVPYNIIDIKSFESISLLEHIKQEQIELLKYAIKAVLDNLGSISKLSN
jgi:type VI protein secretion system component VasF